MRLKAGMQGVFPAPKELVMKIAFRTGLGALLAALGMSAALAQAPAQTFNPSAPKTRAQVRADLRDWRAAGYDPLDWIDYPENAQRAGRIVAARRAEQAGGGTMMQ
jgi:hypothetical protein